jgi:hypothetical protein
LPEAQERRDLLITPYRDNPAGPVAKIIAHALRAPKRSKQEASEALVAYLQGLVAARLSFRDLLRVIVPRTYWWKERRVQERLSTSLTESGLVKNLEQVILWAKEPNEDKKIEIALKFAQLSSLDRYIALGVFLGMESTRWRWSDGLAALDEMAPSSRCSRILLRLRSVVLSKSNALATAQSKGHARTTKVRSSSEGRRSQSV